MSSKIGDNSFFDTLDSVANNMDVSKIAEVFRFISFEPLEKYKYDQHEQIEINYVKKGSCVIEAEGEIINFKQNELMIICSNVGHSFEAGPSGCTLMQLEFVPDIFKKINANKESFGDGELSLDIFSQKNRVIKIVDNTRIERAVERIVLESKDNGLYFQQLVIMYYTELLILIYRYIKESYLSINKNKNLRKAIEYIQNNYNEDVDIGNIAESVGVSDGYLRKLFAKYLNISPIDYCNQYKINKAIELLRFTDLSIKEISFRSGFKSPQYFSKMFKIHIGVTPREYLKSLENKNEDFKPHFNLHIKAEK